MIKQTGHINAKAYGVLYNTAVDLSMDGDGLIATYLKIKVSRKKGEQIIKAYRAKNNKLVGGYGLLRKVTGISLKTLKLNVPVLVNEGLLVFEENGDISILGNNKVAEKYETRKTIKITVHKRLSDTKLMVAYVRVVTAEKRQLRKIAHKAFKIKTISKNKNGKFLSKRETSVLEKCEESLEDLQNSLNTTAILSNEGFYNLKKRVKDNKSSGFYFKRRLKLAGLIDTKRNFQRIKKCTYEEFLQIKKFSDYNKQLTYKNGYLVKESVSSFVTTLKKTPQEIVKGLDKHVVKADIFEEVEGRTYPLYQWLENKEKGHSSYVSLAGFNMWLNNHIEEDLSKIF